MGIKRTSTAAGMVSLGVLLVVAGIALFSVPLALMALGAALVTFGLLAIEVEPTRRARR